MSDPQFLWNKLWIKDNFLSVVSHLVDCLKIRQSYQFGIPGPLAIYFLRRGPITEFPAKKTKEYLLILHNNRHILPSGCITRALVALFHLPGSPEPLACQLHRFLPHLAVDRIHRSHQLPAFHGWPLTCK